MTEFRVLGMTCTHCADLITEELKTVPGVQAVAVDLSTGLVTLTTTHLIPQPTIQSAVESAGYNLAP